MPVSCLPLQACCFVKLIKDFETFPPESLALLPLRFRYELIQNLPAVDVCQLEQSSFVEGLDMEKVWATLCLQRKEFLPTGITAVSGNKDVYFSGVCKILLDHADHHTPGPDYRTDRYSLITSVTVGNCYCTRIIKLLFCCFGTGDSFLHHGKIFLRRYYLYLRRPRAFSDPQLLALVLQMSHYYYPKSLHWDRCFSYYYWESTENYSLLAAYLKEVCNLSLSYSSYDKRYDSKGVFHRLEFIAHILSKRLSSLVLEQMNFDLLENTMLEFSPLLIGDKGSHSQLETFAIKLATFPDQTTLHFEHKKLCCNISDVTASVISRILVANQTSLHTFELTSAAGSTRMRTRVHVPHHICSCLSSFFKQPHLRLIDLSGTLLLPDSFLEILKAFWTAPRSSSSGKLCLHMADIELPARTAKCMSDFNHRRSLIYLDPLKDDHCKSFVLSFEPVPIRLQKPLI